MPTPKILDFDEQDFPAESSKEDRLKALLLIGISKKDANDKTLSLEQKLNVQHDNSAMLGEDKGKKLTTADRIRTLLQQQNFSPLTRLLRLVKIEEAKLEAWNRAESCGMEPRLLECLPKPDKKLYAALLLQLVKYEVPELRAIEVTGNVEAGMTIQVIHSQPQQKVIRVDANSPQKLKDMFGQTTKAALVQSTEVTVEVMDDGI